MSEERSVVEADPLPDALATQKACYDSFESATNTDFESNATQQSRPFDPKVVRSSDYQQLERFKKAEKCRLHSSKEEVDRETEKRNIDIMQAIYLDDAPALKRLVDPALSSKEIQLRILEAIEVNSLMCLDVLCEAYQNQQTPSKKKGELFHRRCGLSFWPIDERPKVTALHVLASRVKSAKALDVLVKRPEFFQDFADMQDSHGSTPLLLAIKCNNMDVVRRLLTTKPDVNKKNRYDETPILIAALKDNADAIQEIINTYNGPEEKTNLEEIMRNIDGKGHSILYPAPQSGTQEVLNLILERDWWQDFLEQEKNKEEDWHTFICNISASGCINLLQQDKIKNELLDVHHEKTRKSDVTPLMRAAEADQEEVVKLILSILQSSGNDALAVCDSKGRNVFHYAVGNPNVLRYLCEMSQDKKAINHMDNSGKTPMKLAAVKELTESFELLSKYAKSEEDMFAAHIIHYVKIEA
ncbi:serine/threonine-protein phosphatase 6 regulatory ankyrin repeat subunit A-like [Dendronephthya gigantea]|uniref:serine/threonine-protein phosphatase 6 regulatory ankyrin repeat subunit A-like n=1 Tax=Dendronephthya gigantea TaxID=151771 RepID=UPI00106BED84|nr:serine/threonine-protein phosphatase 6 regulatory ankyrin repeat subunit A-like [Dendronephthya gigantea]